MNHKYTITLNSSHLDNNLVGIVSKGVEIELHGEGFPVFFPRPDSNNECLISPILNSIKYDCTPNILVTVSINEYIEFPRNNSTTDFLRQFFDNLQLKPEITTQTIKSTMGGYQRVNKNSKLLSDECSICCSQYKKSEGVRTLKCSHTFHKKCIDRWFTKYSNENCPICRANVFI